MSDTTQTTTSTAKPKGDRWQHKELEATIKNPAITRVSEAGNLFGKVRRGKTGTSVLWCWRFRHDNKLVDFTCGTWPKDSLANIRQTHEWAQSEVKAGRNPNATRQLSKVQEAQTQAEQIRIHETETVEALALKWQSVELTKRVSGEQETGRFDNGVELMRSFTKDVFPAISSKPVQAVTKTDCLHILNSVKERGALRMANRLLNDMTQFFNWCRVMDYITTSPLEDVRRKHVGGKATPRDRVLWDVSPTTTKPEAELQELRDRLPSARLQRESELAIWILLSTMSRVGNLAKAQWKDLDLTKGLWYMPTTKNGKPHHVHLSSFALRQFRELHSLTGANEWVLPGRNKRKDGSKAAHVCPKSFAKQFGDRQERDTPMSGRSKATGTLALPGGKWTPHDLRRTGATIMAHLGVSVDIIEKCLAHTDKNPLIAVYQVSNRYQEQQIAWDKLGAHLDWVLTGEQQSNVVALPQKLIA
ncbi:MAG: tyrosine-type recombinase/integrase [Brachymonas sp.]